LLSIDEYRVSLSIVCKVLWIVVDVVECSEVLWSDVELVECSGLLEFNGMPYTMVECCGVLCC